MRLLLKDAWWSFRVHDGQLLSGAVAFYGLLAIAPFGVIALAVASLVYGEADAGSRLSEDVAVVVGSESATYLTEVFERAREPGRTIVATLFSLGFLVFATTRLFLILRSALNHVWGVRSRAHMGLRGQALVVLKKRLVSFGMVVLFGLALFVFVLAKSGLAIAAAHFGGVSWVYRFLELVASVAVLSTVVMLLWRWLPDVRIAWRDLFVGGLVTACAVATVSFLFGFYLARMGPTSAYGAAGSLVVVLLWFYASAQVFFLGAEFTGAWARHRGSGIQPLPHAVRVIAKETGTIV